MSSPSETTRDEKEPPPEEAEGENVKASSAEDETMEDDVTKRAHSVDNNAKAEANEATNKMVDAEEEEEAMDEETEQERNEVETILAEAAAPNDESMDWNGKKNDKGGTKNDKIKEMEKRNDDGENGDLAKTAEAEKEETAVEEADTEENSTPVEEEKTKGDEKNEKDEGKGSAVTEARSDEGKEESLKKTDGEEKDEAVERKEGASSEKLTDEKNQKTDSGDKNKEAAPDAATLKSPPPPSTNQNPPNDSTSSKPPPPQPQPQPLHPLGMPYPHLRPGVPPPPMPPGTIPPPQMLAAGMIPQLPPPTVPLPTGFIPPPNVTVPPPPMKPPMKPSVLDHLKIMKQPPMSAESKQILRHGILARISAFITLVRQEHLDCHPNETWWLIQDMDKFDLPKNFDKHKAKIIEDKAEAQRKKEQARFEKEEQKRIAAEEKERLKQKKEREKERLQKRNEKEQKRNEKARQRQIAAQKQEEAIQKCKEDFERRKQEEIELWAEKGILVVDNEEEVKKLRKKGIISVATAVKEEEPPPMKRKRGRPRKKVDGMAQQGANAAAVSKEAAAAAAKQKEEAAAKKKEEEKAASTEPAPPPKRKRGRPPKNRKPQEDSAAKQKEDETTASTEAAAPPPKRKRGRPPKNRNPQPAATAVTAVAPPPVQPPQKTTRRKKRGRLLKKFTPITFWEQLGYSLDHMILAFSTDPTTHIQNKLWVQNLFKMPLAYNGLRVAEHRGAIFVTVTPAPWLDESMITGTKEKITVPRDDKIMLWGWDKEKSNKVMYAVANMSISIKGAAIEAEYERAKTLEKEGELALFEKERETRAVLILQRKAVPVTPQQCSTRKITPTLKENQTMSECLDKRPYWTEEEELPACTVNRKRQRIGPIDADDDNPVSISMHVPSVLKTDLGSEDDIKDFPLLASLGIRLGSGFMDIQQRQNILRELVGFHRKHKQALKYPQMGGASKDCYLVSFAKRENFTNFPLRNNMEELLDVLSTSRDKSADVLCEYLAKKRPASFMKAYPFAKDIEEKKGHWAWHTHRPEGFKMHDESDENNEEDVFWNVMYTHLLKYRDEVGHCNVPQPTGSFGEWVSKMRIYKKKNDPKLTSKRIELLDKIGFEWVVEKRFVGVAGDPRMNLALVAKLHFPMLTYPEALLIGGHGREEAYQHPGGKRDTLCRRKRQYTRGVQSKVRNEVQRLMFTLEKENGVEELFGKSPYYKELILQKCLGKEVDPLELGTSDSKEEKKDDASSSKVEKNTKDQFQNANDNKKQRRKQKEDSLDGTLTVPTLDGNSDEGGMERFDAAVAVAASSEKKRRHVDDGELDRFDTAVAAATTIENDCVTDNKTKKHPSSDGGLERFDAAVAAAASSENSGVTNDETQVRLASSSNVGNTIAVNVDNHDEGFSSKQKDQHGFMTHNVAAAAIDRMASFHPAHAARGAGAIAGRLNDPFAAGGNVFHDPATDLFNMVAGGADGGVPPYHGAGSGLGSAASYGVGGVSGNTYPYATALAAAPAASYEVIPMQMSNSSGTSLRGAASGKARSAQQFSEGGSYPT